MITEPELTGGQGTGRPAEVLDADDRPRAAGLLAGRPLWAGAFGGAVVVCAVGAAVLQGTGYGHTRAPDLHGYHLAGNPCTTANLQPLVDLMPIQTFDQGNPVLHNGPELDHAECALTGSAAGDDGWRTTYVLSVTIDLHKKSDPRREFRDLTAVQLTASGPTPGDYGFGTYPADSRVVTNPLPGLGDEAYLSTGHSRQALSVLHGGAVISITADALSDWRGQGDPPVSADGTYSKPPLLDGTAALRPALPKAMRHLMSALATD